MMTIGRRLMRFSTIISQSMLTLRHYSAGTQSTHFSPLSSNTIYALSSAPGKAGIAVLRISGSHAAEAMRQLGRIRKLPPARKAMLKRLYDPRTMEPIDRGLMLWFPGPGSFTGEDCVEFHVHGGSAVVAAVLTALGNLQGFRHAEQGEFTKRAFINGKLDLTEVEGLADLIEAETESQRKQALRQMEGDLSQMYTEWREMLIKSPGKTSISRTKEGHTASVQTVSKTKAADQCLANVEAYIDFGEEENIEEDVMQSVELKIQELMIKIQSHLSDNRQGERLRSGVRVAIIGQPNVGKSSLLNAICQRPAAIVSPIAGTTRDVIETAVNIGGYPVLLSDTAGLRETGDAIEREGVTRAVNKAHESDIRVVIVDQDFLLYTPGILSHSTLMENLELYMNNLGLKLRTAEYSLESYIQGRQSSSDDIILVMNKSDLMPESEVKRLEQLCSEFSASCIHVCVISCTTGYGLDRFLEVLHHHVKNMCGGALSGNPSLTQARHRTHLNNCHYHLSSYLRFQSDDVVIAAEQLRKASRELGKIMGKISAEDILDVIFRDFCIGK